MDQRRQGPPAAAYCAVAVTTPRNTLVAERSLCSQALASLGRCLLAGDGLLRVHAPSQPATRGGWPQRAGPSSNESKPLPKCLVALVNALGVLFQEPAPNLAHPYSDNSIV